MPSESPNFEEIFKHLRAILKPYEAQLVPKCDGPGEYYLETSHIMKNGQSLFFGSVKVQKNYVSFYLMPVYVFPELISSISPDLSKRMQGKSCFSFKTIDPAQLAELADLTERGFERYQREDLLE